MNFLRELMLITEALKPNMGASSIITLLSIGRGVYNHLSAANMKAMQSIKDGKDSDTAEKTARMELTRYFKTEYDSLQNIAADITGAVGSVSVNPEVPATHADGTPIKVKDASEYEGRERGDSNNVFGDLAYLLKSAKREVREMSHLKDNSLHVVMMDVYNMLIEAFRELDQFDSLFADAGEKGEHLADLIQKEIDTLLMMKNAKARAKAGGNTASEVRQHVQAQKDHRKVVGKQATQAEEIVNQMIATLPQDQQHNARQVVAKASNKLSALDDFMQANKDAKQQKNFLKSKNNAAFNRSVNNTGKMKNINRKKKK